MGKQLLLLPILAVVLVAGARAVEESESTAPQVHQKAWRESEDETSFGTKDSDSVPSESQDTRSNYQDHPNNGPLLEQERPRQRNRSRSNGKRRRRMRKRPRTTTPETFADETWQAQQQETQNGEETLLNKPRFQSERIHDDIRDLPIEEQEEVKPQQRRRPGRRRRPQHRRPPKTEERYEDYVPDKINEESIRVDNTSSRGRPEPTTQGRKRRRGNGRKRIRVETEPTTIVETSSQATTMETTPENLNKYEESHSRGFIGTKEQLEINTETVEYTTLPEKTQSYNTYQTSTSMTELEEHPASKSIPVSTKSPQEMEEPSKPKTPENYHTEIHSTTFSTRHTSDTSPETAKNESTIEQPKISSPEGVQETTVQPTRSILPRFSSKHKLHSRISGEILKTVPTTDMPIEHNTEKIRKIKSQNDESEIKIDRKALFSSSSRKLPPTSAIIRRRLKQKTNNTILKDDEIITTHLNTAKKYLRNKPEHSNRFEPSTLLPTGFKTNPEILSPMKLLEEITLNEVLKLMTSTTERSSEETQTTIRSENNEAESRLNLEGIELPNIRDEILDLIKSESGSSRLARILELRNMTLTELLEHRERGSSQLYFSESFNKRPSEVPQTTLPTTKKVPSSPTTNRSTEPSTTIIPKTVKPFSPRTAKTTPTSRQTTKLVTTTQRYETETKPEYQTTLEVESREKPTMKIEASIISVPIMEPTHTSDIQFPEEGIQKKFPKFITDTLRHEETKVTQRPKSEDKMVGAASKTRLYTFITETDDDDRRKPRLFESMPEFSPNKTIFKTQSNKNKTNFLNWKSQIQGDQIKPFKGEHKELVIAVTTGRSKQLDVDDILLFNEKDKHIDVDNKFILNERNQPDLNAAGKIMADMENTKDYSSEDYSTETRRFPPGVKSAILASGAILGLAILGFLTVLVSCRLRQKNSRIRGKRDLLCEQLQEDFRSSQCSLSPVLSKSHRTPMFGQGIHSNTTSNRHYYLWRTLRKTFQYE